MKKFICLLILIFVLTASLSGIYAGAAASEFIDSADIVAAVNSDGTVTVTEKWKVSYIGSSDYFYRHIDIYSADSALSLIQKYGEVRDVSVMIDGKNAPETEGINSFTFSKAENGKSYVIAVNCPSAQTSREYQVTYTLTQAVRKDGKDAVFAYMVIGKETPYTSNNVHVTVKFPDTVRDEDIRNDDLSHAPAVNGTVDFQTVNRVYDTYSVSVSCDKDCFESGALVRYSSAAAGLSKAGSFLVSALPYVIAVVLAVVIMLFVLFPARLIRIPRERNVKKIIKNAADDAVYKLPDGVTACEGYKILSPVSRINPKASSKKVPALFAMAVLECMENGYIIPDGDKLIVGTPSQNVPSYIMSVLNFLKTFAKAENDRYVIDAQFAEKVEAECMGRYDVMANYLATFYSLISGADISFFRKNPNKELYEAVYALKIKAAQVKHKPDFAQCMGSVLSGAKTGDAEIFSMLYSSSLPEKMFAKGGRTGETALCKALSSMYGVFVKSK